MLGSLYILLLNLTIKLKKTIINPHFVGEATLIQGDK